MDITKFYNSKKNNFSSNSNTEENAERQGEENAERQGEESPDGSLLETPKAPQDVFEESLKLQDV